MTDNITIKDALGVGNPVKTTWSEADQAHTPHHIIDVMPDIEVVGFLTDDELRATPVIVGVGDGTDTAEIVTGAFTSAKGLRVFGGPTDPVSDIPVMIDFAHHQVHEGETHKAQHIITATTEYLLNVPTYANTIRAPHMVISLDVYEGAIKVEIYENPTRGGSYAIGTAVPAKNHNRNSATTPGLVITHTPTDVTGGTLIETYYVASGTNSKQTAARSSTEWVLKSNEDYRIVVTEVAATTATVVTFDWYEDLGV